VKNLKLITAFFCGLFLLPLIFMMIPTVQAQSEIEKLQAEISERGGRLGEIEKEIAKFEASLKEVGSEKKTLQNAINRLQLERGKVQADIRFTEQKISSTDLQLSKLILEIKRTEDDIMRNRAAISQIIRRSYMIENESMIEVLLAHEQLSEFWSALQNLDTVRNSMNERVLNLKTLQETLDEKRGITAKQRGELVNLKSQYSDQSSVLANNTAERTELLVATKNEESNYQKLLAQKRTARALITKELRDFEAKLTFILDPTSIPAAGTAVFMYPIKNVVITQLFGGTEFAKRNAGVYGGRAYHPGVDFGVPSGTQIFAPLAGTVRAIGNTDAVPGCFSWGKWTLLDHANGLSTLYAHQSVHSVTPGQRVATGEVIGYSGNTGFSTGPHLHFTVYAKDGVSVRKFNEIKTVTSCGAATTPVAATEAYLDPMLYLPPR